MGAAYDAMCENEDLELKLRNSKRKIREQKKLIIELAQAYKKLFEEDEQFNPKMIS